MKIEIIRVLIAITVGQFAGCISWEYRTSAEPAFTTSRDAWGIGEEDAATVGDIVLADGADVKEGPALELTQVLQFSLPGTLGIPFHCTLRPCVLEPSCIIENRLVFAAPKGAGEAEFDGKSVFAEEDELGVRIDRASGEWFLCCDNSRFNKTVPGLAFWKRRATSSERAAFRETTCERLFWGKAGSSLTYSGSSAGEVRFTYKRHGRSDWDGSIVELDSVDYRFDAPPNGRGEIAVRGALIELLSISTTELRYVVRRGFTPTSEREMAPAPAEKGELRRDLTAAGAAQNANERSKTF